MRRETSTTTDSAPLVSVVIPACNAACTISDCLDSILAQTQGNLEVLVCDDGSADDTCGLVESVRDERVRLLINSVNQGAGPARDRAIAACRGQWIALCDADDMWLPGRLEALLEAARGDEYALVFDDIMVCSDIGVRMVPWKPLRGPGAFGSHGVPIKVPVEYWIDSRKTLMQPLFSRRLLLQSGAHHSVHQFGEDTHFVLKLLAAGAYLVYVPKTYYYYRVGQGSATSNTKRYSLFREMLEGCADDFRERPVVYAALQRKIAKMQRYESYRRFLDTVKRGDFGKALVMCIRDPWFLWTFFRHNANMTIFRAGRLKSAILHRAPR